VVDDAIRCVTEHGKSITTISSEVSTTSALKPKIDTVEDIKDAEHTPSSPSTTMKGGKNPVKLSNAETLLANDLQNYDQLRPVIDMVGQSLSLNFWDYSYSSFLVVITPLEIGMPKISFKDKEIEIKVICNKNILASDIKIKIIGKRENENTALRVVENNFKRVNEELVYNKRIESSDEDGAIVDLYYKENQFENHYVKRN
jgi:hypothetical protein